MSLFPEVREELLSTAARRAETGASRDDLRSRLPHVELGRVAVLLVTCSALAVAAVALISLRHQAANSGAAAPGTSLAALESRLAILRRPQTPADRRASRYLWPGVRSKAAGYVPGLTRLAAVVNTRADGRLTVVVFVRRLGRRQSPFLSCVVIAKGGAINATGPVTSATLHQPDNVASGISFAKVGIDQNSGISVGVVPDGVARVKWTFTGAGFGILHPRPVTVYAEVRDNVAIASAVPGEGPLAQASWYSTGGQLIASAGGGPVAQQQLQQISTVNASREVPIAPLLLAHYSLFRAVAPDDLVRDALVATMLSAGGQQLNYWQTRHIRSLTGLDGRGLWVTPGRNWICISDPQASACEKLRAAGVWGIAGVGTSNGSEQTLSGLVPDGNHIVTFVLASGARVTAPVVAYNVYEVTVHGRIVAIIDRDTAGKLVEHPLVGDHPPGT